MRLLAYERTGQSPNTYTFSLIKGDPRNPPQYAILSHRWGAEEDEVTPSRYRTRHGGEKSGRL